MKNRLLSLLALSIVVWSFQVNADTMPSCVLFTPVQTKHVSTIDHLSYTATVGIMPIYNKAHDCIASMSYIAYTKNNADKNRPLTFVYAGGPGASSMTENFLISGPKIIPLDTIGKANADSVLQNNPETWLKFTDLVYIDMVGTGWGRPANENEAKTIFTPDGDANTFSQFILSYLNETHSFNKKIYLLGESYGGFRTPLILTDLLKHFVSVHGVMLISPLLNQNLIESSVAAMSDFALYLPTYTRTALYYKLLSKPLMDNPEKTVEAAKQWATTTYLQSLLLGDTLSAQEQEKIAAQFSEYTGISKEFALSQHNQISKSSFRHHLLNGKDIDFIDSRVTDLPVTHDYEFYVFHIGSFMSSQLVMYPQAMHSIFTELGVKTQSTYINYFDPQEIWHQGSAPTDVISVLHNDLMIAPKTKVFVGVGYYDMAIPYFVTQTAIAQLHVPESIQKNITIHHYAGGHMFYTDPVARKKYYEDIKAFYQE